MTACAANIPSTALQGIDTRGGRRHRRAFAFWIIRCSFHGWVPPPTMLIEAFFLFVRVSYPNSFARRSCAISRIRLVSAIIRAWCYRLESSRPAYSLLFRLQAGLTHTQLCLDSEALRRVVRHPPWFHAVQCRTCRTPEGSCLTVCNSA